MRNTNTKMIQLKVDTGKLLAYYCNNKYSVSLQMLYTTAQRTMPSYKW